MIDSRCGLHCTGCSYKESHGCGGCIETMGQPFHGSCSIATCCQSKGYEHCGQCNIIPCDKMYSYSYNDPEHGDHPPGNRVMQCRRWAAEQGINAWRNVLLTSAGFFGENARPRTAIIKQFNAMLSKPMDQAHVLFIPTAATDDIAKAMAEMLYRELLSLGVSRGNINVYDAENPVSDDEAMTHDVIFITGGDTTYLLNHIKATGLDNTIKRMVCAGKVYVGVSAGSIIASPNIGDINNIETSGLALVNAFISVHCAIDAKPDNDRSLPHVMLSDEQALVVGWDKYSIISGDD